MFAEELPVHPIFRRLLGAFAMLGLVAATNSQPADMGANMNLYTKAETDAGPRSGARVPDFAALVGREDTGWLNSAPVRLAALQGKVVLVDFWTYSCINSLRNLPHIQYWAKKYGPAGLIVIGVHSPEFGFEKQHDNVVRAVRDLGVGYPIAIDSGFAIWNAFHNEYWPADYLVDRSGRIRYSHFGEGDYHNSEHVIQELLEENGAHGAGAAPASLTAAGAEASPSDDILSPETYVGYDKSVNFASPESVTTNTSRTYSIPTHLELNSWALRGAWTVRGEFAALDSTPGAITFRFHSRDLHLVSSAPDGATVRFKVRLDGRPPGRDRGVDVDADGSGTMREPRLYQLVRQSGAIKDRTVEIDFLDPGARAYVFTFG